MIFYTEENVASFKAHAGAVTGIQVDGDTLYRSCWGLGFRVEG
jgi:hypothetical protein